MEYNTSMERRIDTCRRSACSLARSAACFRSSFSSQLRTVKYRPTDKRIPTPSTKLIQAGVNRDRKMDGICPKAKALSRLSAEGVNLGVRIQKALKTLEKRRFLKMTNAAQILCRHAAGEKLVRFRHSGQRPSALEKPRVKPVLRALPHVEQRCGLGKVIEGQRVASFQDGLNFCRQPML